MSLNYIKLAGAKGGEAYKCSGTIKLYGTPIIGSEVILTQPNSQPKRTITDVEGGYKFGDIIPGRRFMLTIKGPVIPLYD